jgi:hypothetical protein
VWWATGAGAAGRCAFFFDTEKLERLCLPAAFGRIWVSGERSTAKRKTLEMRGYLLDSFKRTMENARACLQLSKMIAEAK